MATIVDSYSESNYHSYAGLDDDDYRWRYVGQSFTGDGGVLNSIKFYLAKEGVPTGTVCATIHAHSGTYGTSSVATGAVLAISDTVDISELSTDLTLVTFIFSGEEKITLTDETYYVASVYGGELVHGGSSSNYIAVGVDDTSPTHSGNGWYYNAGVNYASFDTCFYVYADASSPSPSLSPSSSTSPSQSPSVSPSSSVSPSPSPSLSPSSSVSPSQSPSLSPSSSQSPSSSPSESPSNSPSASPSSSVSPSESPSLSPSSSQSSSQSPSSSPSESPSSSPSLSSSPSPAPDVITIGGIDRTADIINQSIVIEDIINEKANTCSFSIIDRSGNGIPETDDEVIITDGYYGVVFGGYVTSISLKKMGVGTVMANINCVDYTRILDRYLVHKSYENMTDKEIIEDIVSTYCVGLGITTTNVEEGVTIDQISFNYLQISQVLKNICKLTNRNWYIDYDKDIHYFAENAYSSPFDIDSSCAKYKNLNISKNSTQLKNRVYVRGGTKLSDLTDYITVGDGETTKFNLPDKPHDVTVYVDTGTGYEEKTLGIKNIDTSGFDWYLNYQEKYIEQDSGGSVLTADHVLKVNYKYDIPILVAVEDTESIMANGVQEFAIFDTSISTTTSARNRAIAELTDYSNDIVEGSFETQEVGFNSGQTINISLTEYGVDDDYIIQSVISKSMGAGIFTYKVKLASAKTLGIIGFLIRLLEIDKNLVKLDDDEVVDELLEKSDALLSDSLLDSLTIDSCGAYFTWCDSDETTPITRARWDLFSWG
ncbi:hypothetical protein KKB83_04120 [Patescibacteria group bacterium]|nr:hypothetical protein [Patescibacteria group bacterium]